MACTYYDDIVSVPHIDHTYLLGEIFSWDMIQNLLISQ